MRYACGIAILLCFSLTAIGQTESSGGQLQPGDTLLVSVDHLPSDPHLTRPDQGGYWNFRNLQAPYTRQIVVRENTHSTIPGDLVYTGPDNIEYFVEQEPGTLSLSAFRILASGHKLVGTCDPPVPIRIPSEGRGEVTSDGQIVVEFPFEIVAAMDDQDIAFADSLRMTIDWQRNIKEDIVGQIDLESGLFEAVRQVSSKTAAVSYEVSKNGQWSAIEDIGLVDIPQMLKTGRTMAFWNEMEAQPLAIVELTSDGAVSSVQFKSSPYAGRQIIDHAPKGADIIVHPNPTFGFVRFDLVNLQRGTYSIEIYNIIGVQLKTIEVDVDGRYTLPADLSDLRRGTYIYRLVDAEGSTIRSKRLVIIQP